MKILHPFFALAACVALLPLAPEANAGTGVGTSPYDATVDTRGDGAIPTVTVTMHRVGSAVMENAIPSAGIDDALVVRGTDRGALAAQPIITGGLVADGVTPLLFKVHVSGALPSGIEVSLRSVGPGRYIDSVRLVPALKVLNGTGFSDQVRSFNATSQQPTGFVVLPPINPERLVVTGIGVIPGSWPPTQGPIYTPVLMNLEVTQAGFPNNVLARYRFGIRKPPVVLLHGYNTDATTWSGEFVVPLSVDRGFDFVRSVGYGTEKVNGTRLNTTMRLRDLIGVVDGTLDDPLQSEVPLSAIAGPWSANWSFARYDVIGHSQGGVLARLLCSSEVVTGSACPQLLPFKSKVNHYRGRFRRVVTVGSPHVGSTICELGTQLHAAGIPWGSLAVNAAEQLGWYKPREVFQEKFRVGNGSELFALNNALPCDPAAKIHMLWTTVDSGQVPGHAGSNHVYYKALHLNNPMPVVDSLSPGEIVVPNGADAVVPVESQGKDWPFPNRSSTVAGDLCHAGWGVTQTAVVAVANRALDLLNGPSNQFGRVVIPANVTADMETARGRIADLSAGIDAEYIKALLPHFRNTVSAARAPTSKSGRMPASDGAGDETLQFVLEPLPEEALGGPVTWMAEVYGPQGASVAGLTLAPGGANGEELALTVAASVQGEVVLRASYVSAAGKTIIGQPAVVLSRAPGTAITGIEVRPGAMALPYGSALPVEVWAVYDGTTASRVFSTAGNTAFTSSNQMAASVDADGLVRLLIPGSAVVTALFQNQWSAQCQVTVLGDPPVVTSAASVSGTVGQAFSHQLMASQAVQTFAAAPLPPGLTLNAQTGLISGAPTAQGASAVVASVANANGTGSKQVDFVIAGPPGAPTDVGLDAAGVSEQKPMGMLVGRFTTADPNPLDTFTYQLVAGTGDMDNASFTITGDQLFTAAVLNRATQSTVSLRVRTTDSSAATFENAIVLPVMAPPAITRHPDPQHVFTGDRALFVVEASGLEPLGYQWKKNGVDIAGESGRILEFAPADPSDAGSYTVTVTNGDGIATSTAVSLIVDPASYEKWLSLVPNATGGPVYEPLGDFNQDGVRNFLEFAFGVSPGAASGLGAQPFVSHDATGPVFTYYAANGIEPLTYRIMKSGELATWQEHFPAPGEVTTIDHGGYLDVQVRMPWADPKMFLKLEVGAQ